MLHRSFGLRRPKSQKRPVDRNRTLRSEWLEERWLLSGYGLSGVGLGALLASASNSAQGPAIVTPATASLASTGKTAVLSVAASDSATASSLVYTWSVVSGPAHGAATFQSNGSNGAKTETVTFSGAGTYDLAVRVTDPKALAATSSVYVTVSQVINSIVLTPSSVSLATGGSQQFSASALDQFGIAMATPPAFTWSATAGTISSKGLYTASNVSDSKVTITAHSGAISSTAAAVVGHAPTISKAATATLNSTATGAALSIGATDDIGGSDLNYNWSVLSAPAGGTANFSVSGGNAAKNTTVTFNKAGTYSLQVVLSEPNGLFAASSVSVNVTAVPSHIAVTPATIGLNAASKQQFAASESDQFGNVLAAQPTFSWSASTGSINTTGLFTAPAAIGSVTVTAHAGSLSGTATVTVKNAVAIAAPAAATLNSSATAAALSVAASDGIGASDLSYQWSLTSAPGGGKAVFSVNGSNAANANTVTFNEAGTYTLLATATGSGGASAASSVTVTVAPLASSITVTPGTLMLNANNQQFTASASDQFGNTLAVQPTFSWTASAGTISASGLFMPTAAGSVTVTAGSGSLKGTATVTVQSFLSIVTPATVTLNSFQHGGTLSAQATDAAGGSDLSYRWTVLSAPAGASPSLGVGSSATSLYLDEAGDYTFQATITASGGLSVTSSVSVNVPQNLDGVYPTPCFVTLGAGSNQQFQGCSEDQFGRPMAIQPSFTWSASDGTISPTGLFTAPLAGGSLNVYVSSGSFTGWATVTVLNTVSITTSAAAALSSSGTTAALSVAANDTLGGSDLNYVWTVTSEPAGNWAYLFSDNNSNTAKNTTITFRAAGTYILQATATGSGGATATSSVTVNVAALPTSVAVTPAKTTLNAGSSQQFAASQHDQFGHATAVQPAFTWSTSAGSITASGMFTAPAALGTVTVKAQSGSFTGTATVTLNTYVTITTPATATLNGTTTGAALSVAATDGLGAADSSYKWSVTSAPTGGTAVFATNGSNAAQNTSVAFNKAGTYTLLVTVTGSGSVSVTSSVSVVVVQEATLVAVTSGAIYLAPGTNWQFVASASDQFGNVMATQPPFTWSASGGTINGSGLFTTPATLGSVTVTVSSGSISATAKVTVQDVPTITVPAAAVLNTAMTGAALSVLATDDVNDAALKYLWYVTSAPAGGTATVGDNGDNSAKNTTVTFDEAGSYTLEAIVSDTSGVTATSSVTFVVAQVASSITVTRGLNGVINNASDVFTAIERDQFGGVMAKQPGFTWSATGCTINNGTITPPTAVGTYSVTAQAGSLSGTTTFVIKASATATLVTPAAATLNSAMTGATLSVAATDSNGGGDLCYTWYMQSGPTNGAVIFGVNGCNASQNTTVIFNEAGTYLLRVSINTSGKSIGGVSSPVTVTVGSVPGSIDVTPSTASIAAGGTQQFSARERDQFGSVMAEYANVTWSASAGTINSNWVYTAPATAGNVTVTAKEGSLTCTAHLTVAGGVPLNLHDQGLMALVESLDADGSISRQDMLTIFNSVEINNLTLSAS